MEIVFVSFAFLAGSFLLLRNICLSAVRKEQNRTMIIGAGLASWLFILSAGGWIVLNFYLFYALVVLGSIGAMIALVPVALLTGIAIHFNEVLDTGAVLYYLRDTALFRPMRPRVMLVQEELDKKKILDVHRQTSDRPFPVALPAKRLLSDKEIQQLRQELRTQQQQTRRSGRFEEEIKNLTSGNITTIAEPWKVYTFGRKSHDWYAEMSGLEVDPSLHVLRFQVNVPGSTQQALRDPKYVFHLKQEIYQLFQVLNTDPWLQWYTQYFDQMSATLVGIQSDSFGHTQLYPFMKIAIKRRELTDREGKFFNAADLHTVARIVFDNGNPLPDNP